MKLTEVTIRGYKSIEELTFPIKKYGDSYTTILLGKNESGKSNVLDAMSAPKLYETGEQVDFIKTKNQQKEPEIISVVFSYDLTGEDAYRENVLGNLEIPQELVDDLNILSLKKEMYLINSSEQYDTDFDFTYDRLSFKKYSFLKRTVTTPATTSVPATTKEVTSIVLNSEVPVDEKDSYTQLDKDSFYEIIKTSLQDYVENITIPVDIWKSEDKYLIKDKIQLKEFAKSPDANIPLKNMFYLAGYDSHEKIAQVVSDIEKDNNKRKNLKKTLSKKTTEYLNSKWEEHKISIDVDIESDLSTSVSVQDDTDDDHYFDMADRSQGFKQFVSLLLSISISSASGDTKDHLILIDEPEVHLHPSGVRFMLKELLEIGKHNYLFISTHSNFMLDRETKERHYLLSKDRNNLTSINQIQTDDDINDDEVLQTAFGINVISDFLSPYKLLVEGETDKNIISRALEIIKKDHGVLITNGTGSNIASTASLLSFHDITPMVAVDDDDAGRKTKIEISKISKLYSDKVFTIRDLNGNIVSKGTIEDTISQAYVQSETNKVLRTNSITDITLQDTSPVCEQIKTHLNRELPEARGKKQQVENILTDIKVNISKNYKPTATKLQQNSPKLKALTEEILKKFKIDY